MAVRANSAAARLSRQQPSCLQGLRAKDPQALARLYDETSSLLYALALRMLNEPARAEEVMLSVYQQVWETPEVVAGEDLLGSLILLTRGRALDRIRQSRTAVPLKMARSWGLPGNRQGVTKALEELSSEEREVMELAFFHGLSAAEMANTLGAPIDTIRKRVHTGTGKLRKALRSASRENVY